MTLLKKYSSRKNLLATFSLLSIVLLTAGCSSSSDDDNDPTAPLTSKIQQVAIVATVASDYTSGAHATVDTISPYTSKQNLAASGSDITVEAYGSHFYRLERSNADNITKFSIDSPATPIWQYSVGSDSNPHSMTFVSDNKAYVTRYNTNKLWIINPSTTNEDDFKIGEIDLSAYDDGDGHVEMTDAALVDNKLFVILQRLDTTDGSNPQSAYIAVIDATTDTEIDTQDNNFQKGILLSIKNPGRIQVLSDDGKVYISGLGRYGSFDGTRPAEYTGGIVSIDPDTYQEDVIVDDGNTDNHPYGQISNMQIISANKGYFVGYAAYGDNSVYAFNPVTGIVDESPLGDFINMNIAGLAADEKGQLWISTSANAANNTSAGISIVNSADNSIVKDKIELLLNPTKVVFVKTEISE